MNSPPKNTSEEEFGGQLMGKSDQFGRSEAGWPNQHQAGSRMAESTSGGRPEAEQPNQHQAIAEADRPTTTEGKRPNQHQTIRSRVGRSPKQGDRPDDRQRSNPSRGQTAGVKRPKPEGRSRRQTTIIMPLPTPTVTKTGLQKGTMALSPQRPLRLCPRQRLLKPTYRGVRWHYLHGVHYATTHAGGY